MVSSALTVPFHQQDKVDYCGPACAQMLLSYFTLPLPDQPKLAGRMGIHTAGHRWATAPDGLFNAVNEHLPGMYTLFVVGSEDEATRAICWSIQSQSAPAVALVFGTRHWTIVTNYHADAEPASASDTGYTLISFDVNNPWPAVPAGSPEPPHHGGDACGDLSGNRGTPNFNVSRETWQNTYMTGVNKNGCWDGRSVALCRKDHRTDLECKETPHVAPDAVEGVDATEPTPPDEILGRAQIDITDNSNFITPDEAVGAAFAALESSGLLQRQEWAEAFTGTQPGPPIPVVHLQAEGVAYFIVPFVADGEPVRIPLLVCVDAFTGEYRESIAQPGGTTHFGTAIAREEVNERFPGGNVNENLVWMPCLESLSTLWPFYVVDVDGQSAFVRIDGEAFAGLTEVDGA